MINLIEQPSKPSFADEELESIFTVGEKDCETHDLLGCSCGGCGLLPDEADDEADEDSSDGSESFITPVVGTSTEEDFAERAEAAGQGPLPNDQDEQSSLAELLRWRHYSPCQAESWEYFKSVAGFTSTPLNDLTFAFHTASKF
ncbi:hypothetical protein COOONC_25764 [Cooperia oncophora]